MITSGKRIIYLGMLALLYNSLVIFLPFHSTFRDRLTVPGAHWTITYFLLLVIDNQWRTICHRQCVRFAKTDSRLLRTALNARYSIERPF